MKILIESRI